MILAVAAAAYMIAAPTNHDGKGQIYPALPGVPLATIDEPASLPNIGGCTAESPCGASADPDLEITIKIDPDVPTANPGTGIYQTVLLTVHRDESVWIAMSDWIGKTWPNADHEAMTLAYVTELRQNMPSFNWDLVQPGFQFRPLKPIG